MVPQRKRRPSPSIPSSSTRSHTFVVWAVVPRLMVNGKRLLTVKISTPICMVVPDRRYMLFKFCCVFDSCTFYTTFTLNLLMKDLKWRILKSTMVLITNGVKSGKTEINYPMEVIDDYFVTIRPEVALILPVTSNQEIILVRQYRHGAGEICYYLPVHSTDEESPQAAAIRELKEETGYITDTVIHLTTYTIIRLKIQTKLIYL